MITIVLEDWIYKKDYAFEILTKHFQTVSLKGFGIADLKEELLRQEPFCITYRNTTQ
jgi:hypothetical protein